MMKFNSNILEQALVEIEEMDDLHKDLLFKK